MQNQCNLHYFNSIESITKFENIFDKCSEKFSMINFLNFHYYIFNRNYILLLIFVLIALPFLFYNVKLLAENFLAETIDKIIKKFKVSKIVASCTLIPFANGAPDVMVAMAATQDQEGLHIAMGSLIGAFIFALTLIICSVIYGNKESYIQIERKKIYIEIVFYFLALVLILIFGYIGKLSLFHALFYLCFYFVYIYLNLKQNTTFNQENQQSNTDHSKKYQNQQVYQNVEQKSIKENDLIIEIPDVEQKKFNTDKIQQKIYFQIDDVKQYLFPQDQSKVVNLLEIPFRICYFLTIPHHRNPLIKTQMKFVMLLISEIIVMQLFNINLNNINGAFAAVIFIIVFLYLKTQKNLNFEKKIFMILSLFVSIAWLKLISSLILDTIEYFSFLFNVSETFLSIVIISAGNSLGDMFANQALAQMGNQVVALIATFSSQIFNIYIGIPINMISTGNYSFDLFNSKNADLQVESLLIHLITMAMGLLILHLIYVQINDAKYM